MTVNDKLQSLILHTCDTRGHSKFDELADAWTYYMARTIYDAEPLILRYDGEWDILLMLGECCGVESFNYLHKAKIGISIRSPKLNIHFCLD